MSYQIHLGQWNSIFAVPSAVVDQYIKLANEAQLKVLLYLLRHAGEDIPDSSLSDALHISAEEVANALQFWTECELLKEEKGIYTPSGHPTEAATAPAKTVSEPDEKQKKPHTTVSRAQRPDSLFVSKLLQEDPYLASLLEEVQSVLKKPLSSGDTATIVMLYDSFGLPCEVIGLLLNYLNSVGSANMRAIEKLGIRWSDEGIKTIADAEREIERMMSSREAWGRVSALLGIRNIGNPTKSQLEHADRWLNLWGFSDEMITEAYERCVNTKGEYNIRYINAILQRWHEKNLKSLDALKQEEASAKNKPKAKGKSGKGSVFSVEGASFDISKYESNSLFDD